MKTISGREINVTPNHSKRTFTIRVEGGTKYRTLPMSGTEFNEANHRTGQDWQEFLRRTDDYYKVR